MSSVQDADNEVRQLLQELEEAVSNVRQAGDELAEKKKREREARVVFKKAKTANNRFRREIHRMDDPTQKSVFSRRHSENNEIINKADGDLKMLIKPPRKRPGLTTDEQAMTNIMGDPEDMNDGGRVMQAANRAQDDNLRILANIERDVGVTEELGNEITNKLATDTEKIRDIDKELNTLQANLDRAKGEVAFFYKQMATDKCFLCLIFLVILALCLLTFWKIYKGRQGDDDGGGGDSTPPAAPPAATPPPAPSTSSTNNSGSASVLLRALHIWGKAVLS